MIDPVWTAVDFGCGMVVGFSLSDLKRAYKARKTPSQEPRAFCGSRFRAQYGLGTQNFSKLVRCEENKEHRGLHSAELGRPGTLEVMCLTWCDEESLDYEPEGDLQESLGDIPDVFQDAWGPKLESEDSNGS